MAAVGLTMSKQVVFVEDSEFLQLIDVDPVYTIIEELAPYVFILR